MKVVRLSALRTSLEMPLVLISVRNCVDPGGHIASGNKKKTNDPIGTNRKVAGSIPDGVIGIFH